MSRRPGFAVALVAGPVLVAASACSAAGQPAGTIQRSTADTNDAAEGTANTNASANSAAKATAEARAAADDSTLTAGTPAASASSLRGVVVLIDPGHNGANARHLREINRLVDAGGLKKPCNTTGTGNSQMTESRLNWLLAQQLGARLTRLGASVKYTRPNDAGWGPCIDARGKMAARVGAAVLVSLHGDGEPSRYSGFHVIYRFPGSAALATRVRNSLADQGLSTSTLYRGGLVKRSDLGTLNWSTPPAVMLESGNMKNGADAALLDSVAGRERFATGIAAALLTQFGR